MRSGMQTFVATWTSRKHLLQYLGIALLLHLVLLGTLLLVKVATVHPEHRASFEAAPLPPPLPSTKPDDRNAFYRNFDYKGPNLGEGGGTPGVGSGGIPNAGA